MSISAPLDLFIDDSATLNYYFSCYSIVLLILDRCNNCKLFIVNLSFCILQREFWPREALVFTVVCLLQSYCMIILAIAALIHKNFPTCIFSYDSFYQFCSFVSYFSFLGICLGLQVAVIEFARHVLDWKGTYIYYVNIYIYYVYLRIYFVHMKIISNSRIFIGVFAKVLI